MFGLPQEFLDSRDQQQLPNLAASELGDYERFENLKYVPDLALKQYSYSTFLINETLGASNDNDDDCPPRGDGHYVIDYVDLIDKPYKTSLVWYPALKCFGTMDIDHGYLFACKDVDWKEILQHPGKYLIGKWEWEEGWDYIIDPRKEETFTFVPESSSSGS